MTVAVKRTIVIQPRRSHFVSEVHSFLKLTFESDSSEDLPIMTEFLEESFDSHSQLHLNDSTVRYHYFSTSTKLPGKVVVENNLLGNNTVNMVLESGQQHFTHKYVHVQILLVDQSFMQLCSA